MFFSGLFSTHIPYIILAAVYSISLGIYSVYYINNKISERAQVEKEIQLSDKTKIINYYLEDYLWFKKTDVGLKSSIPPHLNLKPLSFSKKLVFTPFNLKLLQNSEFKLFSRPPPVIF